MDIKTEIRTRREALGWTKRSLSRRLELSGDYIGKVEAGTWDPSLAVLRRLGQVFRENEQPFSESLEASLGIASEVAA